MTTLALDEIAFDSPITIAWWEDATVRYGFDPRSLYVERFWLPVLGPSATWLLRHFANRLDQNPNGARIDLIETARELGLGDRSGRHGPFMRTLTRTVDFKMAKVSTPGHLAVRKLLPMFSSGHLCRLPESLREAHAHFFRTKDQQKMPDELERRGRQLALSLLMLEESDADVERQLVQWRFPPALARSCVAFATKEHERRVVRQGPSVPAVPSL